PPAGRRPGGLADRGGSAGVPAMGARLASRPAPAAGLVPPRPDSPERARPTEERPGRDRSPDAGATPFRTAQSGPARAAGGPGAGSGSSPPSKPTGATPSTSADPAASTPTDPAASTPGDAAASTPTAPPSTSADAAASADTGASELAAPLPRR